jgi:hypothetical protein
LLTVEDHKIMANRAEWHQQQVVHYLEMATGPYNRLVNPDKRKAVKEGILGAIPGVVARVPKAAWMGAIVSTLNGSMGDSWQSYYDAREYLDKAAYHADCAEEIYALLEEDWDRHLEKLSLDLERNQE